MVNVMVMVMAMVIVCDNVAAQCSQVDAEAEAQTSGEAHESGNQS